MLGTCSLQKEQTAGDEHKESRCVPHGSGKSYSPFVPEVALLIFVTMYYCEWLVVVCFFKIFFALDAKLLAQAVADLF